MAIPAEQLVILRCPVTHQPLRPAERSELELVNLRSGGPRTVGGVQLERPVASGMVAGDLLYPTIEGIHCLLPDYAINLANHAPVAASSSAPNPPSDHLHQIKEQARIFYDEVGWHQGRASFIDAELWEDLRPVSAPYRHAADRRIHRHLPKAGRFLLDAASGPIQHEDHLALSADYDVRICVDFSMTALREVQAKLGDRALCILGDVTNLPLRNDTVDAFVSLHTIYHIPIAEQRSAFLELHRVLTPGGQGVIVYFWGTNLAVQLAEAPIRVAGKVQQAMRRFHPGRPGVDPRLKDAEQRLYFGPHSHRWFAEENWPFEYQILTWRALSLPMLRNYIPNSSLGQRLLHYVARVEERFPEECGIRGSYPLIVVRKPSAVPARVLGEFLSQGPPDRPG